MFENFAAKNQRLDSRRRGPPPPNFTKLRYSAAAMAKLYRAAVIGTSRMGAFIDNEIPLVEVEPNDARLSEGPVSTLGTPMALFSAKTLPMGHSGAYTACDRTELCAGCDLRQTVLDKWGPAYGVAPEHLYTDYKEMLAKEQPDIVSVCTQPEHRADIVIYCAEHGVKAIYAEKAFAASVKEAEAAVQACAANGVFLNLGTNR